MTELRKLVLRNFGGSHLDSIYTDPFMEGSQIDEGAALAMAMHRAAKEWHLAEGDTITIERVS